MGDGGRVAEVETGELAFGPGNAAPMVEIGWDGTIKFGPDYEPDAAARLFWDAVIQRAPSRISKPEIVVLCGSTRFYETFQRANYELTMAGKIVLTVGFYPHAPQHGEGVGATSDEKVALDELHKRKIDMADRVLVLNVDGYIGDSTRSEIEYAERFEKPIEYLEPPSA